MCHTRRRNNLKTLSIREMRSALSRIEEIVAEEGEVVVTRRGRPLARILPPRPRRGIPSRAEWRASMPKLKGPSEELIRQDRGQRGAPPFTSTLPPRPRHICPNPDCPHHKTSQCP